MNPPDPTAPPSQASNLDCPLTEHNFFSKRATNTLLRQGIATPRLLLMHTQPLLHNINEFGPQLLLELKIGLEQQGWCLAETVNERQVTLTRFLTIAFSKVSQPLSPLTLTQMVNSYSGITWSETEVAEVVANHPYVQKLENGLYEFQLHLVDVPVRVLSPQPTPDPTQEIGLVNGKILLSHLWPTWIAPLKERHQEVLFSCYGIQGEEPLNFQEAGEGLGLTRERVRQIKEKALRRLYDPMQQVYWQPMHRLLSAGVQQAHKLMTPRDWERWLDENVVWQQNEPRPALLRMLCDLFPDFHYISRYGVATVAQITDDHLIELHKAMKYILGQAGKAGLTGEQLILEIQQQLPIDIPADVCEPAFIIKAIDLFDRIGRRSDGRYVYLRKKARPKYAYAITGLSWLGEPGTRLYEWELKLRQQFAKVAWIGQVRLTEADFMAMCQAIQEEAQAPNYFSKVVEGQPLLVPPAVFITTMVLSARYAEQYPEDATDEFWHPYLRTVWGVEYTQAFYARCKKRFNAIVPFLEETYSFEFPRTGKAQTDVTTPLFRHALIPRYMQSDFAQWLHGNWRNILAVADTPATLAMQLQKDQSLDLYYSHRLKSFIRDAATAETAAVLITNMATAISLYINDGESIESICDLLADSPIEQELWLEIVQAFAQQEDGTPTALHFSKPRVTWIWSLDEGELILRVQNIILSADNKLEGEPDRLVWVETVDSDPLTAAIEVEVTPWYMKTGERIIQDVFLAELDGPLTGFIVLLTDMDEIAARLSIPPCPTNPVQFFRPAQQGAYGIPVDPAQVSDGIWFVCAEQPLTFIDEDSGIVEPDGKCSVPYPLTERYNWAAQLTLNLPITVWQNGKELIILSYKSSQLDAGQPALDGENPILCLSSQVQPTFTDTQVVLTIPANGERLLKQASLWVQGQDGWRWQKSLTELHQLGHITLVEDALCCDFSHFLPLRPNFYTVELRISLQLLFSTPMRFAILPGLQVKVPIYEQLYTPAKPFQLLLSGVDESAIVYTEAVSIDRRSDNFQQITWADLRHEPRLVLRFGKVIILLAWSVPRFMAWLEPKPAKPQVTLEDLRQITLHAVSAHTHIESFTLFLPEEKGRSFPLRRGRHSIPIGQSQLYDMVRKPQGQRTQINIQVGTDTWALCEVLLRADLPLAFIEDAWQEHITVSHSAEDFLLQLIEMAEAGTTKFTPAILYRLATIPATVLDHFSARHLKRLWPTLAALKVVHNQSSWIETHGLLPAWILLPKPVILKTVDHGIPLRVHPIQVAQGGLTGKGYGRWRMSADDNAPKEMVYVQWQPISGIQVHVEAGLPEVTPNDWTEIELLDTYGLYYCGRCTRLTGVRSFTLPDTITKTHFHGRDTVDLRDITKAEEHGGYRLLAECFSDRREELLIDIFEKFEIALPAPADHLPEPLSTIDDLFLQAAIRTQFVSLIQEVTQYGADREESSPWASATRLLNYLNSDKTGGELRQAALALSMVLRLAAYDGLEFRKLLTKVELSEVDIQSLLAELHRISAAHLQWGLTWAELLIIHSPGKLQREDKK